ncbi:MAG: hypothetical protein JST10_04555 [Bacteroidetes bacterium]|nr:hypothetical protein [Bacteroidota bacterium]MBS1631824.1 hypothetical protein [Bacteroidota bacterium]
MTRTFFRFIPAMLVCALFISPIYAQDDPGPGKNKPATEKKSGKSFKILTSGKRVTVQSTDNTNTLKQILVWTSSGHRIVEQHKLDATSFDFSVSGIQEKVFFMMVELKDGRRVSEKFGVR